MAYEQLTGPLGQARDDVLNALITERITNTTRGRKSRALPLAKFLPRWGTRVEGGGLGDDQEPPDQARGDR